MGRDYCSQHGGTSKEGGKGRRLPARVEAQWTLGASQVPSCTSWSVPVTGRLPPLPALLLSTLGFCLCEPGPLQVSGLAAHRSTLRSL